MNNSYGQFGEDSFILSQYTQSFGYAIEVGGADGINGSPTKCLEERGWKTLLIEPNPQLFTEAKKHRPHVFNCAAGEVCEDNVGMTIYTLDTGNQTALSGLRPDTKLIEQHQHMIKDQHLELVNKRTLNVLIYEWAKVLAEDIPNIDFVSIDTEGTELDVMKGFDVKKWQPKIIALENNFEDYNYRREMFNYGYIFYNRIGVNDYYIRESYLPQLPNGGGLDLSGTPLVDLINKQNEGINKNFNVWKEQI
jgi:FkbM family methyltransferase